MFIKVETLKVNWSAWKITKDNWKLVQEGWRSPYDLNWEGSPAYGWLQKVEHKNRWKKHLKNILYQNIYQW